MLYQLCNVWRCTSLNEESHTPDWGRGGDVSTATTHVACFILCMYLPMTTHIFPARILSAITGFLDIIMLTWTFSVIKKEKVNFIPLCQLWKNFLITNNLDLSTLYNLWFIYGRDHMGGTTWEGPHGRDHM